ncbi:unnamed protein product [Calicophoron daubneyi]|uniref:Uncharacterized protein n=1 Tax=Calicophoron daubneyi TaxID=300641 RepID=A0AAV2TIJ8_CALDB
MRDFATDANDFGGTFGSAHVVECVTELDDYLGEHQSQGFYGRMIIRDIKYFGKKHASQIPVNIGQPLPVDLSDCYGQSEGKVLIALFVAIHFFNRPVSTSVSTCTNPTKPCVNSPPISRNTVPDTDISENHNSSVDLHSPRDSHAVHRRRSHFPFTTKSRARVGRSRENKRHRVDNVQNRVPFVSFIVYYPVDYMHTANDPFITPDRKKHMHLAPHPHEFVAYPSMITMPIDQIGCRIVWGLMHADQLSPRSLRLNHNLISAHLMGKIPNDNSGQSPEGPERNEQDRRCEVVRQHGVDELPTEVPVTEIEDVNRKDNDCPDPEDVQFVVATHSAYNRLQTVMRLQKEGIKIPLFHYPLLPVDRFWFSGVQHFHQKSACNDDADDHATTTEDSGAADTEKSQPISLIDWLGFRVMTNAVQQYDWPKSALEGGIKLPRMRNTGMVENRISSLSRCHSPLVVFVRRESEDCGDAIGIKFRCANFPPARLRRTRLPGTSQCGIKLKRKYQDSGCGSSSEADICDMPQKQQTHPTSTLNGVSKRTHGENDQILCILTTTTGTSTNNRSWSSSSTSWPPEAEYSNGPLSPNTLLQSSIATRVKRGATEFGSGGGSGGGGGLIKSNSHTGLISRGELDRESGADFKSTGGTSFSGNGLDLEILMRPRNRIPPKRFDLTEQDLELALHRSLTDCKHTSKASKKKEAKEFQCRSSLGAIHVNCEKEMHNEVADKASINTYIDEDTVPSSDCSSFTTNRANPGDVAKFSKPRTVRRKSRRHTLFRFTRKPSKLRRRPSKSLEHSVEDMTPTLSNGGYQSVGEVPSYDQTTIPSLRHPDLIEPTSQITGPVKSSPRSSHSARKFGLSSSPNDPSFTGGAIADEIRKDVPIPKLTLTKIDEGGFLVLKRPCDKSDDVEDTYIGSSSAPGSPESRPKLDGPFDPVEDSQSPVGFGEFKSPSSEDQVPQLENHLDQQSEEPKTPTVLEAGLTGASASPLNLSTSIRNGLCHPTYSFGVPQGVGGPCQSSVVNVVTLSSSSEQPVSYGIIGTAVHLPQTVPSFSGVNDRNGYLLPSTMWTKLKSPLPAPDQSQEHRPQLHPPLPPAPALLSQQPQLMDFPAPVYAKQTLNNVFMPQPFAQMSSSSAAEQNMISASGYIPSIPFPLAHLKPYQIPQTAPQQSPSTLLTPDSQPQQQQPFKSSFPQPTYPTIGNINTTNPFICTHLVPVSTGPICFAPTMTSNGLLCEFQSPCITTAFPVQSPAVLHPTSLAHSQWMNSEKLLPSSCGYLAPIDGSKLIPGIDSPSSSVSCNSSTIPMVPIPPSVPSLGVEKQQQQQFLNHTITNPLMNWNPPLPWLNVIGSTSANVNTNHVSRPTLSLSGAGNTADLSGASNLCAVTKLNTYGCFLPPDQIKPTCTVNYSAQINDTGSGNLQAYETSCMAVLPPPQYPLQFMT